jgi:cystathionine beta-lyase
MSNFNFDQIIPRRGTGSIKWEQYPADVLPMWVADMDFASPPAVVAALQERAAHAVFGYPSHPHRLAEVICERMARLYQWDVQPEQILFLPGLVSAINVLCRAFGEVGDSVLTLTPAYPPFLSAPRNQQRQIDTCPLALTVSGSTLTYAIDFDAFTDAIHQRTRLLLLSHPHNPVGLEYDPPTLRRLAEICIERNVIICSDEIHCDLLLGDTQHIPLAALDSNIAAHTITLMAPSKTFNLPGLGCSMAIIPNPELRRQVSRAAAGIVPHVNVFGFAGALAAYEHGDEWLTALLHYLTANRDRYVTRITTEMAPLRCTVPQATYLGWIDCRDLPLATSPYRFFLDEARVAFSDGAMFGPGGEGFIRINFGCPRSQLDEALDRVYAALQRFVNL